MYLTDFCCSKLLTNKRIQDSSRRWSVVHEWSFDVHSLSSCSEKQINRKIFVKEKKNQKQKSVELRWINWNVG